MTSVTGLKRIRIYRFTFIIINSMGLRAIKSCGREKILITLFQTLYFCFSFDFALFSGLCVWNECVFNLLLLNYNNNIISVSSILSSWTSWTGCFWLTNGILCSLPFHRYWMEVMEWRRNSLKDREGERASEGQRFFFSNELIIIYYWW